MGTVNRVTIPRRRVSTSLGRHWMTVWHRSAGGETFERIDIDSGVVLETAQTYRFTRGTSDRPPAAPASVPIAERFGPSASCPVMSVPPAFPIATMPALLCCCPCECGGHPGPLPSAVGALLPSVLEEWDRQCSGGGVVPSASDPTDAESWVS